MEARVKEREHTRSSIHTKAQKKRLIFMFFFVLMELIEVSVHAAEDSQYGSYVNPDGAAL